ncbi:SDR family NAD(P)-dependent oxidoreductase [Leeia sp.]|uniref:SDR family NAD(P)-dependent oxidoreductase n=1 Tax=Leeia sp. TaxID=2884678 RepID=UPI0035AF4AF6
MSMLAGKVVIIAGGFGFLGMAVAAAAQAQGARVALLGQTRDAAPARTDSMLPLPGVDLTDLPACQHAVQQVLQQFGRLDGLINVAGGFRYETLSEGDVLSWDLMYQMNLRTALTMSKAVLPTLLAQGQGRIVNIGANAAARGSAGMGAYTASKAGVARLTESLADELKTRGITVNAVLPGIIDTPANRADMPDADTSRWVAPADIATAILFLLSDAAHKITGASLPVTGSL